MSLRFLQLLSVSSALLLPSVAGGAEKEVKASAQSIECLYPEPSELSGDEKPVLCTVRLHLTPSKGLLLWTRRNRDVPPVPLVGKDEEGNLLIGLFREWEACFDSGEGCWIMVYDFYERPHGKWLAFDTEIRVPVSRGTQKHDPVSFLPTESATLSIAGKQFAINPVEGDDVVFDLEYDTDPDIASIAILDAKGNPLKSRIIEGEYNEEKERSIATYCLASKGGKASLSLETFLPCETVPAKVRFKIGIGGAAPPEKEDEDGAK